MCFTPLLIQAGELAISHLARRHLVDGTGAAVRRSDPTRTQE